MRRRTLDPPCRIPPPPPTVRIDIIALSFDAPASVFGSEPYITTSVGHSQTGVASKILDEPVHLTHGSSLSGTASGNDYSNDAYGTVPNTLTEGNYMAFFDFLAGTITFSAY